MEFFSTTQSQRNLLCVGLFFLLLAISLLAPLASKVGIANPADYVNHLALLIQSKRALLEGQFPLRVAPFAQDGWRYPYYQFYSPTTYTLAAVIYRWLTPSNPLLALELLMGGALWLGGLYMSRLAYWFIKSWPAAILAGVVYLFAPYLIIVVDFFGNLNETLGLSLLPIVIYYNLQRYLYPRKTQYLAQASLAWYLLITVHLVSFVYVSAVLASLLVLISLKSRGHVKNLLAVALAYALGALMAFWYLVPIAWLAKFFMVAETYGATTFLNQVSPLLSHLLFSSAALTEGFKTNGLLTIHPALGWPMLFAAGLCFYAVIHRLSSGQKRADYWLSSILALFVVLVLLVWSPFNFWRWLPSVFLIGQYSWRLLGQAIWLGALLFAWAIYWLFKGKLDLRHVLLGTLLIAASVNSWFPHHAYLPLDLKNMIEKPQLVYNENAYIFNFRKYPHLVNHIDSLLIDPDPQLKLSAPYTVERNLLNLAYAPTVHLQGNLPPEALKGSAQLTALVNGVPVATRSISAGDFSWNFPVIEAKNRKDSASLILSFKLSQKVELPLQQILLQGFLQPQETLNVKAVQPHCQQQGISTLCELQVPSSVQLLELPVLYYPQLLRVKINGQASAYESVLYQGHLITAVKPQAGRVNKISVQFQGLGWANQLSWVGWGLWALLLLSLWLPQKMFPHANH